MLEPLDKDTLARLQEHCDDARLAASPEGNAEEDLLIYHLRESRKIAVDRARKIFDRYMSELEVAFSTDIDNANSNRRKVDSELEKVLGDIKHDVRSMTDTLVELTSFMRNVTLRQEALSKREFIAEKGQQQLRVAKIRVYEAVTQRTMKLELPSALLLFLFQPWTDYMCFTALRFGDRSKAWDQAIAIMENLIWAVKVKNTEDELHQLAQLREPLLMRIQEAMRTIRYDETKCKSMIDSILKLIDKASSQQIAVPAPQPFVDKLQQKAEAYAYKAAEIKDYTSQFEQEMLERLRNLEFGSHFRFADGSRYKLAWCNGRTSHFMLVNVNTQKPKMMSGIDLARTVIYKKALVIPASEVKSTSK